MTSVCCEWVTSRGSGRLRIGLGCDVDNFADRDQYGNNNYDCLAKFAVRFSSECRPRQLQPKWLIPSDKSEQYP